MEFKSIIINLFPLKIIDNKRLKSIAWRKMEIMSLWEKI